MMSKRVQSPILGGKKMEENIENKQIDDRTEFSILSPFGLVNVDIKDYELAKNNAKKQLNPPQRSFLTQKIENFLGGEALSDTRYYSPRFGSLMKYHLEHSFSDYIIVKEFTLEGQIEVPGRYSNTVLSDQERHRFLQTGIRFYENEHEKFVLTCSVDEYDKDERITIHSCQKGRGLQLLDECESSFYGRGPLKNAFFDMNFEFIRRIEGINELLAWNVEIRDTLIKDVLKFIEIMPLLKKRGLPSSRGIILSGPPGTGKTMMAKSLASEANITTILISAEMIQSRSEIKSIFELGRKLSPTLVIIEDIDTAGTVSRKFTDHPILGEYLQSLDGMNPNEAMVILATTNHTENIDPAISDRPGRFDRIIEVPLPNKIQRREIIQNLLSKMPTCHISKAVLSDLAKRTEGLSGAWIREVVQTGMIDAFHEGSEKLTAKNLLVGLEDVLNRRGLAYRMTPSLHIMNDKNVEAYTA
jgi:hypothetical protein